MADENGRIVEAAAPRPQSPGDVRRTGGDGGAGAGTSGDPAGTGGVLALIGSRIRRADRRDLALGWLIISAVTLAVITVNALTNLADIPGIAPWEPWVWEGTSAVMLALLIWLPWLATAAAPPMEDWSRGWTGRARLAVVHALGLLTYAALHVGGFVLLRQTAYELMEAGPYRFDALGHWTSRFVYELRKDTLSYAVFVAVFTLIALGRRRRVETLRPVSFDIRDGSRIIRTALDEIVAASSAGNYVEFWLADGRRPLMRTTLAAVEVELGGFGFVRAHRSWLVNARRVKGLRPDGSGDWTVELGVVEAPVSRRYPQALERLKAPG